MIKIKEKNFISAVLYVRNNEKNIVEILEKLDNKLFEIYEKYEIICVNDFSTDLSVKNIAEFSRSSKNSVISIINMSYHQGLESSMNAGLDLSIGDFVFEFDYIDKIDYDLIDTLYFKLLEGYDIVSAAPKKTEKLTSKMFYKVFNSSIKNGNELKTETFRILSRKAINRIHSMNKTIPYRKAVYATSGLKLETVYYLPENSFKNSLEVNEIRKETAINALIIFSNLAYKISLIMFLFMLVIILAVIAYTISVFLTSNPIEGWTTMMLFIAVSFLGIFLLLAIIMKYLSIIIELVFKENKYMIESIEKLSN